MDTAIELNDRRLGAAAQAGDFMKFILMIG